MVSIGIAVLGLGLIIFILLLQRERSTVRRWAPETTAEENDINGVLHVDEGVIKDTLSSAEDIEEFSTEPIPINDIALQLSSSDGQERVSMTSKLFERGMSAAEDLRLAGAKLVGNKTFNPPRIDVVYTLLTGSLPERFVPDSFGVILEEGRTRRDMRRLCKKYGLEPHRKFDIRRIPNCYVTLSEGEDLVLVMKQILSTEPSVMTLTFNLTVSGVPRI
jgi:hypothetical protein